MKMAAGIVAALLAGAGVTAAQEPGSAGATPVEYEGWRQYMVHCARCHGDDAVGGLMAPDLRASLGRGAVSEREFHAVVSAGRPPAMPAFGEVLRDEQIAAIVAYVTARAGGGLPAGRPRPSAN